jgi:regulator of protease activity HflC (stomatin/prohibitin superfamily)
MRPDSATSRIDTAGIDTAPQIPVTGTQAAALATALGLLLLVCCSVRSVAPDERMVVTRGGRATRLRGPGVIAVVPGLDRGVRVALAVRWYEISWLDATTRDAVRVVLTAAATGTVRDPLRYVAVSRPDPAAEWVLEAELRRSVAQRDLAELATLPVTGFPDLAATVSARTATWGIEISDVQVGRVDVRVDPGLVRWANTPDARR